MLEIVYSSLARQDIAGIALWSEDQFGDRTAALYLSLIRLTVEDLAADPLRLGSLPRPDTISEARICHLYHGRRRAKKILIKKPRHFIVYRVRGHRLEVGRIPHDEMVIDARIAKEGFGSFD